MPRLRSFAPDASVFQTQTARRDGGRASSDRWDDNEEPPLPDLVLKRALRRELLEVVDGDELQLELATRRAADEPLRTTAAGLGLDAATVSRRGARALRQVQQGVLAKLTAARLARDGGVTINPTTARSISPTADAYAVAVADHNQQFDTLPTWRHVVAWLRRHWDALLLPNAGMDHNLRTPHIGAWHDRAAGHWELDLTLVVQDQDLARCVAIHHGQKAIYHFATDRELFV